MYLLTTALVFGMAGNVLADVSFSWSGLPIIGENPAHLPSGTAVFSVSGNTLTLTLTNTSAAETEIGQTLSGLTWDISDGGVVLSTGTAMVAPGSGLIGNNAGAETDLSSEWGFKDDISALLPDTSPLGSFGVSSVGDIGDYGSGAQDSYGPGDRFDTTTNLWGPDSLNGMEGAIVGPNLVLAGDPSGFPDGFASLSNGPVVQNAMIFTFTFTGTLTEDEIGNVTAMYGSDGSVTAPAPPAVVLGALGLVIGGAVMRKRQTAETKTA
jgi:hypothetical protein